MVIYVYRGWQPADSRQPRTVVTGSGDGAVGCVGYGFLRRMPIIVLPS